MAKYKLREFFSVQMPDGSVVEGPCELECSEEIYKANIHKFDWPADQAVPGESADVVPEAPKKKKKSDE